MVLGKQCSHGNVSCLYKVLCRTFAHPCLSARIVLPHLAGLLTPPRFKSRIAGRTANTHSRLPTPSNDGAAMMTVTLVSQSCKRRNCSACSMASYITICKLRNAGELSPNSRLDRKTNLQDHLICARSFRTHQ